MSSAKLGRDYGVYRNKIFRTMLNKIFSILQLNNKSIFMPGTTLLINEWIISFNPYNNL